MARPGISPFPTSPIPFCQEAEGLREVLPDVYDTLLAAGAFEHDVSRNAPRGSTVEDRDLIYLRVRREVIEWALRNAVLVDSRI